MRLALLLVCTLVACSDSSAQVERGLVGTWEMMVPNPAGIARWVWDVRADGTYAFHAEGPGDIPTHSGVFQATRGRYALRATTMMWVDSGTYQLAQPNTLRANGVLGAGVWTRVPPARSRPDTILAFLGTHPLVAGMLEAPFGNPRTDIAGFDAQAQNDGVIGVVRTVAQSPSGPGTISVRIYRDWTTAQAAYTADAVFDSPSFRNVRGQFVTSQTYVRAKSKGHCLARTEADDPVRRVTCYMLVQDPSEEAVIIVSEFTESRSGTDVDASPEAYTNAAGLLTAGMRYLEINFVAMTFK